METSTESTILSLIEQKRQVIDSVSDRKEIQEEAGSILNELIGTLLRAEDDDRSDE